MKESISSKTIRSSIYNSIGFIWPILIAFFTIPIIIKSLGNIEYGYYIFIGTLLSIFGLIDLGIGTAITKFISEKIGENDIGGLKTYIGVSKLILLSIALLGFFTLSIGALASLILFNKTYSFLSPTIFIASLIFLISVIQSLISISLQANQRFDILSKLGIFSITFQQIGLAYIAYQTKNINLMFISQLAISLVTFIIGYTVIRKIFPAIKERMVFDWVLIKKFYKYGISTFFVGFFNSLLTYFDKLIIPIFLGPQSLTYYTVPGTISTKIPSFSSSIGSIIFSMASNFQGAKDDRRQKILYQKSSRIIILVSISLAISTIVLSKEILGYWINFEIAKNSYLILIILCLTSIFLSIYNIIQNILLGTGKFKELVFTTIIMLVIDLLGLFILLPAMGILGAAIAYLLSVLPVLILKVYVENKYFEISYFDKTRLIILLKYFLVILFSYLIGFFILKSFVFNLITAMIVFSFINLIFLIMSYFVGLIEQDMFIMIKKYVFKK